MDLLAIVFACSLHSDDQLVRAIVQVQSEGNAYFVGDITATTSDDSPRSAEDANRLLAALERKGHRPALGLMGLSPEWAAGYGRQPGELWDACLNIRLGSAKISEFDYECRRRQPSGRRRPRRVPAVTSTPNRACIARKYALELGLPPAFVGAVLTEILAHPGSPTGTPSTTSPTSAPSTDDIFFSGSEAGVTSTSH
jgi:hypothetical protein